MANPKVVTYSNEKPPIYQECVDRFGADWDGGTIFTYGDVVHCKYNIPDHLKVHEGVHVEQQLKIGKKVWWGQYFIDREFRLKQELEAYRTQIAFIDKNLGRDERRKIKKHLIKDLALHHGNVCTKEEAEIYLYGKKN